MASWDSYADDVDALKSELENLVEARNHVMRRINMDEDEQGQQQMLSTNEVQLWLSRVQALQTEVGELIQQASEEIDRLHPGGFCSRTSNNKSSSYNELEDMVADKLQAVMNLTEEGAAFLVANEVPVVTTTEQVGDLEMANTEMVPEDVGDEFKIVGMESLFDEVCKCLQLQEEEDDDDDDDDDDEDYDDHDDDEEVEEYEGGGREEVGIVGIYGMGGVGKTALLKQIYNKLLLDLQNKIGVVIWVSVSKDLQLEKIQEQIGIKTGMFDNVWKKKSLQDKASDIFNSLKEKKFVLLMDGLWERVDLTKVGIPLLGLKNSSKIVFTTRSLEICSLMEADRQFKVKCLAEEEAWKLFQMLVGDYLHDGHPEVLGLARDISKECYGLPLALVRIGRAMDGKQTPQEWRDVLAVLRRLRSSISGSDDQLKKDIYYHLKLSYDNLQNDMFKTCLLYCCLFPRNYRICKRDLIDCWIGEGFLDDRLGAQMQGYYIIDVFLSASLLEEEEDDNYVKMHNWIHDMGLWITSEIETEGRNFFVHTKAGLTELPEIRNWKNVTRMSVIDNSIRDLKDAPTCPRLQTLFLNLNFFKTIGDEFFQFMCCLKVLNLSNNILLQELPSEISKLVALQHLDLSRTGIKSLPKQLGALKKLKCLNLEHTFRLHIIPRGLISKFSVLYVLRLWECGLLNNPSVEDSVASNDAQLLIEELLCLKNLSMLSITLRNSHAVQKLLSSYELQSCTQSLWLQLLRHPKSIIVSLTHLKHLNILQVSECECLEELEVDFVGEPQAIRESPHRFNFLHQVLIDNCPNLRNLTCLMLAPNLKHLQISQCSELEEIIKVGKLSACPELIGNSTPFSKLEILKLSKLPNLRSIYWSVLPFPKLKKSTITNCPKLHISLPPCLINQDEQCEGESEERSMEITSSKEADVPPEPSALKGKSAESEAEVLGSPELPWPTPTNVISPSLKASRSSRIVNALSKARLQDGYVSYPWEKRKQELLPVPNSSCFLSLLLLPKASDVLAYRYNDMEDTLARANAWLNASQASGVPIVIMHIQTESLLTKISGETASATVNAGSLSDLSNIANASLYGFEDYHGVDLGVVRAVRLCYAPLAGEVAIEIKIEEGDSKLGFAISRTDEGFIYISSVIDDNGNVPSSRSGLSVLYKEAISSSRLLVVSRVSNQKVLPWMVSATGAIRCFDTVSLSQKLSVHRHAKVPVLIHVFLWDQTLASKCGSSFRLRSVSPPAMPLPSEVRLACQPSKNQLQPLSPDVDVKIRSTKVLKPKIQMDS